ncbi:MAG: hypothetical protein IJ132_06055, partial [Firmicutes bacterium]|nr:hypothetical protein [Bacillota bacterium]
WGKKRKLRRCFRYVMNFHYKTRRKFRRTKDWPAVYANDHFLKGSGNCHSDAAAFAYLAASCGYERVYIASDTSRSVSSSHSWTEVNGRAFDPLFAQAKSYSRNWDSRYGVYELSPAIKVKIPYGKASHNKKGKMIPKKTQPYKEKPKPKVLKIEKWSAKDKKLYYNDGSVVKGTVVWKGKFYAFTDKGKYREDFTKKLRSAATEGKDISELTVLIGNPKKKTYADSCYSPGPGKDGIWKYSKFTVYTYKPESGQEIFISAE